MINESTKKIVVGIIAIAFIGTAFLPTVQSQLGTGFLNQPRQEIATEPRDNTILLTLLQKYAETTRGTSPHHPAPLDELPPNIHLPPSQVTMRVFSGTTSYFRTLLSNVPSGYEVSNRNYTGWCSDLAHYINLNTPYQVTLYSSYNTSLPSYLYHQNWSKVNYILNHKIGTDWHQVQYAIYYILDFGNQGLNTNGWAMVNAAITYGGSYIPSGGDIIAVIAGAGTTVQRTIFEVTVPTYLLSISNDGNGTVTKDPDQPAYTYGQIVSLTANPEVGWSFDHWSGDASGTSPTTSVTMDGNKSVTAYFTENVYSLTISVDPVAGGSVDAVPSPPYHYGDVVTLTATASVGYSFDHWSGDASGSSPTVTVTMDSDKAVTAHFTQNGYTLTISIDPVAGGSVAADPSPPYHYGDVVTLTATASVGYSFDHWSGDASGTSSTTTVTMDGDKSVTAHFTQNVYILTITVDPVIGGSVSAVPAPPYHYNDVVTLTASANPGYSFDHWSGDASGSSTTTTVTIDGNKSVVAHFTQNVYTLTVSVDPVAGGSVVVGPPPPYHYGTVVTLNASANAGYSFDHWSGDLTGTVTPANITMNGNKSVTAHFTYIGDTTPPTVEIAKPLNAIYLFNKPVLPFKTPVIIQGITIEVNASDNQSGVNRVEFSIDNIVKGNDSSAPYSYNWNDIRSGKHTIKVTAFDNAGNSASAEVSIMKWRFHPLLTLILISIGEILIFIKNEFNPPVHQQT